MKKSLLLLSAAVLAASPAHPPGAAAADPLTLSRVLRQAETASASSDLAGLSLAVAREGSAQVRASWLPELAITGGFRTLDHRPELLTRPIEIGPLNLGAVTIPNITVPSQVTPIEDRDSWRYQASLQYLVWDFGKRHRALSASRAREEAVEFDGRAAIRKNQSDAAGRYLTLLNIKAQKRVVGQRLEALKSHLDNVSALFDHGVVAQNDLLRTQVALRSVQDADAALDQAYASALEGLNVAMGLPGTIPQEIPEEMDEPPAIPWNEAACRARAAESNESVRALRARVRALEKQASFSRKAFFPDVVAEASHSYAENDYLTHEHQTALFVGLSWKVFDGGIRSAKVRQSNLEVQQAERELLEAGRLAENAAAAALRAFQQSRHEEETARENVKAAEENLRIVGDQYQEGLIRNTDVLDAEATLAEARSSLAERRYGAYSRQIMLLAVMGEDIPAFYEGAH